jgi:hypothetical protein
MTFVVELEIAFVNRTDIYRQAIHKQRGKKHGKGTVKTGNGFASVAYEGYRNMAADSPIVNTLAHQACNAFPACRSSGHAAPAGAFLRLGIKASCTFHKGLS